MDRLIEEIRAALRARMYILGLQGVLALVDICAALGSEDGRTRGALFKEWFTANLADQYRFLSPDDLYQLRCGMLHQGRTVANNYAAILFTLPDGRGNVFHNNILNDALNLDLITFSEDVIRAAERWWKANEMREPVRTNAKDLARIRPDGLAPYIGGVPLLA